MLAPEYGADSALGTGTSNGSGKEAPHGPLQGVWLVAFAVAVAATFLPADCAQAQNARSVVVSDGPGWTPWAILISALIGAATAIVVVAKQRITAHKRAALDFLLLLKTDRDYKEDEQTFAEMVKKGSDELLKIMDAKTGDEIKQRLAVINYLNVFELMCLSIQQHILDEDICKSVIGDNLAKRWHNAKRLIEAVRNATNPPDNEFFEHFERMARAWGDDPKVAKRSLARRIWNEIRRP